MGSCHYAKAIAGTLEHLGTVKMCLNRHIMNTHLDAVIG